MAIKIYIDQGHNPESPNSGAEWYGVPKVVSDQLQKEAEQMTDAEKEESAKNAPAPTTDTVSS